MRIPIAYDRCILCLRNPADSWEHILPECIGGRTQVQFLCESCNSRLGTELVAGLRSDPSIRLAVENLKRQIPELARSIQQGLPYLAEAHNGSTIEVVPDGNRWRVRGKLRDGSTVLDPGQVLGALRKYLRRRDSPRDEIRFWEDRLQHAEQGEAVSLPTGQTLVKRQHSGPIAPAVSPGFVDPRCPALIAYEFVALLIHDLIYGSYFDAVRAYIVDGRTSERITVERLTSRKYAPGHMVDIEVPADRFVVNVRFFRWLWFRVTFNGCGYHGPEAELFEDLKGKATEVAIRERDGWQLYSLSAGSLTP